MRGRKRTQCRQALLYRISGTLPPSASAPRLCHVHPASLSRSSRVCGFVGERAGTLNRGRMATSAVRVAAVFVATCSVVAAASLVSLVDTRIGTGGHGFGVGSLNPGGCRAAFASGGCTRITMPPCTGAQVPFGAMRLGPDTSYGTAARAVCCSTCVVGGVNGAFLWRVARSHRAAVAALWRVLLQRREHRRVLAHPPRGCWCGRLGQRRSHGDARNCDLRPC